LTPKEKGTLNLPCHYNKKWYELIKSFMDNKPMLQLLHDHDLMASNDNAYVHFEPFHEQMQKVIMRPLKFEVESRMG